MHFQIRRALRPTALQGGRGERLVDDAQRQLARAYDLILRPLAAELRDVRRIVFVPRGPLHIVPFHALHDGAAYLIETHETSSAPSASLWLHLARTQRGAPPDAGALVVGAADALAPHIEDEARAVAGALPGSALLLGAEASAARVMTALAQASLAHLACHGHSSADNPLGSGLKLADRWLSVREVYDLRLPRTVVALSGCEAGRSAVAQGDELLGLVRGLLAAGASGLLVSLWTLSDIATSELMTRLYTVWQREGKASSLSKAVRQAQRDSLVQRPHPALWAPFVWIGDL